MKKGLILGRFQPLHMGHLSLFETVINNGEELLICIGSSNEERTENNPYSSSERIKMINRKSKFNYFAFHLSNPIVIWIRNLLMKKLVKNKYFLEKYLGSIYK